MNELIKRRKSFKRIANEELEILRRKMKKKEHSSKIGQHSMYDVRKYSHLEKNIQKKTTVR